MSDFNLQIKIRNARMLRKMREHGHHTAADLSRASGVSPTEIGRLLMLKSGPINELNGDVRPSALKICEALNATMQDLWPASMCGYRAPLSGVEVELTLGQVAGLLGQSQEDPTHAIENRDTLTRLYAVLNARERRVVDLRSQNETFEQIGKELGVTRERIRQIEFNAHRKMRRRGLAIGVANR